MASTPSGPGGPSARHQHGLTNAIVRVFLNSNLSVVLILISLLVGLGALLLTPREEDPQIVVPLADVYVNFPGHSAEEVEQLVATPLEKILYEIDGVEYVYSMSQPNQAIITVRFYVGEDREHSLVKLYKRIDEHLDVVPPGVQGWVVKPVEIDDVPIVNLTLTSASADDYILRRVADELVFRLSAVKNISRAYAVGGRPRVAHVYLDPDRMQAYHVSPLRIAKALQAANVMQTAGEPDRLDTHFRVDVGEAFVRVEELGELVVAVSDGRPVFLKDVATIRDGPAEVDNYVRHGWGPARDFEGRPEYPGALIGDGGPPPSAGDGGPPPISTRAVTIAIAKKKGTNAVWVARDVIEEARELKAEVVPDDIELVITRNYGLTADDKVNDLIEALGVAVIIVVALLTLGLNWRAGLIVALAIPVVFGMTLAVNMLAGYTINRVTLFALILALGLLVDDPIVDVENITRHFALRGKATRQIVLEAVAEIRPPLIVATLAVIVSFLPMFFLTGMMGPYMRPMALNVPVTMLASMIVAFTITPWLSYHMLKGPFNRGQGEGLAAGDEDDLEKAKQTWLYRAFYPLMAPLLRHRLAAYGFLAIMAVLTIAATSLGAFRLVPLKMLPFANKTELLLVLDFDEGTTLERTDAAVREFERYLATVPEVVDFVSYVGLSSPMDFNGMVRHYYLRRGPNVAEIRVNLVDKKSRRLQSHALGLRMRDDLTAIARRTGVNLKIVEIPPGPPVLSTIVAEVYGRPDHSYADLIAAAKVVRARMEREPFVVDIDDTVEADWQRWVFVTDKEKAALHGVTVDQIARTLRIALAGQTAGTVHVPHERWPLKIELRVPRALRSSPADLSRLHVIGQTGALVPLAELGRWEQRPVDKTIFHKNLRPVVYVMAETAGRPPVDPLIDILADKVPLESTRPPEKHTRIGSGWVADAVPRPLEARSFIHNGGGIAWAVPRGIEVSFSGEGEWHDTLRVFRDLGLAFAAALVGIYVLLVAQLGSFLLPVIVMLAIPLTILGIMPGFWLLNVFAAGQVGQYADPVLFTATAMIGMIALAGIVTRQAVIIVDFIHLAQDRGHSLFDSILLACSVRLRPILLTVLTDMLAAVPITTDPIFSGLAWSLIFGLVASTVFTLFVIPVTYWLIYRGREAA